LNIKEYDSVKLWLTKLGKKSGSPGTRKVYLTSLRLFCEYAGMTPDELIAEKKQATGFKPEERLDRWFVELTNTVSPQTRRKLARNTCVLRYNAVSSFYKSDREAELEMEDSPSSWTERTDKPLTHGELGKLLEAAKQPMHKAYILCQAQSGLSVSDLLKVSDEDVLKQVEKGQDYVYLRLQREKEKQAGLFDTFFGRMSVEAVKEYAAEENLKDRLFPCTDSNIRKLLQRLSRKAGLEPVRSHRLRKFFNTNMKMAGLNETLVESWMGHNLGKIRAAYFIPPVEEQLKLYKQAEKHLEPVFSAK
jgi:integrase